MIFPCRYCGKQFYIKPSHKEMGRGIYCSRTCSDVGRRRGKIIKCTQCQKNFYAIPKQMRGSKSGIHFCSRLCYLKYKAHYLDREGHPMWKTGENSYLLLMRRKKEQFCRRCGIKNKRVLVVHHVDRNRKNNVLSNLVWLCRNCHHLVHKYDEEIKIRWA